MITGAVRLTLRSPWSPPLAAPLASSPNANPTHRPQFALPRAVDTSAQVSPSSVSCGADALTARERRQLRNEKRESRSGGIGWREQIEEQLLNKAKNQKLKKTSWTEELNLDHLARLGPQWWIVRVSRVNGHETADRLARSLARNYPSLEFKVYFPTIKLQNKLKNGSVSVKLKPLFPGCVFLNCVLNKELHDFIREVDGIGGFVGSKVGNTKRQINKPKPVPVEEMDAIFQQAKEEQDNVKESNDEQDHNVLDYSGTGRKFDMNNKPRKSKKDSDNLVAVEGHNLFTSGANVCIISGPLSEYIGCIKEFNPRNGKVTVSLQFFGKEIAVDLGVDEIVLEAS